MLLTLGLLSYLPLCAQNPIIRDQFTADPTARVFNGKMYLYPSHDIPAPAGQRQDWFCMADYHVFSSENLTDWEDHGVIVTHNDVEWVRPESYAMWAPDCVCKNGKYYFYVSTLSKDSDCKAIGVAVADHPEGPYTDALGKALVLDTMSNNSPQGEWSSSAHTVFMDDDGTPWLCWGYGNCFLVRLKRNMTELDGEICALPLENYLEAPWLYKHGGRYYLAYSSMGTGRENLSYSVAGSIQGPWDYKGPLTGMAEDSYTIHPGIVDFDGKSYLFYHNGTLSLDGYGPATGRRSVCVDELMYTADGSIRPVEQTRAGVSEY